MEVSYNGGTPKPSPKLDNLWTFVVLKHMVLGIPHDLRPPYVIFLPPEMSLSKHAVFSDKHGDEKIPICIKNQLDIQPTNRQLFTTLKAGDAFVDEEPALSPSTKTTVT